MYSQGPVKFLIPFVWEWVKFWAWVGQNTDPPPPRVRGWVGRPGAKSAWVGPPGVGKNKPGAVYMYCIYVYIYIYIDICIHTHTNKSAFKKNLPDG